MGINRLKVRRPMREVIEREVVKPSGEFDRYGNEKKPTVSWVEEKVSSVQIKADPFWSTTVETSDVGDMVVHAGRRSGFKVGERVRFEGVVYTVAAITDLRHPEWSSGLVMLHCSKSGRETG